MGAREAQALLVPFSQQPAEWARRVSRERLAEQVLGVILTLMAVTAGMGDRMPQKGVVTGVALILAVRGVAVDQTHLRVLSVGRIQVVVVVVVPMLLAPQGELVS